MFTDPKCYVNCASHDERLGRTSAMDPRDAIAFPVVSKELKVYIQTDAHTQPPCASTAIVLPVCTQG